MAHETTPEITRLILEARAVAYQETAEEPEPEPTPRAEWPIDCTVGPGLEGAIACETKVGYVNGTKGRLLYRGYDIFDLCAYSTFEEVCCLLLHGALPSGSELAKFKAKIARYRQIPDVLRRLAGFPVENMSTMGAMRLGTNLMRTQLTVGDQKEAKPDVTDAITADDDSVPMETAEPGRKRAAFEFPTLRIAQEAEAKIGQEDTSSPESSYQLIAGLATLCAAIVRLRAGRMPIDPDPEHGHAANFMYMMTGRRPDPAQERIMDIALILHADHGMNASTFAAMVVASTLADIFFSVGAGIGALGGPLHGGANEDALRTIEEIGGPENVPGWYREVRAAKRKIPGFGHRVYKTYDPRARILGPLAASLAQDHESIRPLFSTARALEELVVGTLGKEKRIYPNVDFYSGMVYRALGMQPDTFTPAFAVSRVAGWTARVLEYLEHNRIFRPRALYVGDLDKAYVPLEERG